MRVANIGLIGGVLAALIAALLGGVVAGLFAFANTTRQATGETERSRAEFLRDQRQDLYARVLADEATARTALEEMS